MAEESARQGRDVEVLALNEEQLEVSRSRGDRVEHRDGAGQLRFG
jgi:hypothetical protein